MSGVIGPGATIGVLGGGQLGRMFAMAARRLGYRVHTLAPEDDTPTGQISDVEVVASYDDLGRIAAFARDVDVVTFEFENVSAAAAATAEAHAVVRPNGRALQIAQHRLREKTFLRDRGLPVTPFYPVTSAADLERGIAAVGRRAVLKTASFGYDGKGQVAIGPDTSVADAWQAVGAQESILEAFVDLEREISVIGARGVNGDIALFAPFENVHVNHILDVTVSPATLSDALRREAEHVTRAVLESLDYIGILCVEFFVARDGHLMINELAPRPHNSGHLTIEATATSQFEQQLRAICGLPLGATDLVRPAAMANLLGDLWSAGEPDWAAALAWSDVKLHLYGKSSARPGRKMGHITALGESVDAAREKVVAARQSLVRR